MLKMLKFTTVAMLFAIQTTIANTPLFMGKTQLLIESAKEGKTLVVQLKDVGNNTIKVTIKDNKGETLKENEVKGNEEFTFRYNLENLPLGVYNVSFSSATAEYIQPIDVCKNCVNVMTTQLVQKHKPSFRFNNDKLDVNVLNSSQKPVTVTFFNEDGDKIMEDISVSGIAFGRRFDLSNLDKGTYFVAVKLDDATYYNTVNR